MNLTIKNEDFDLHAEGSKEFCGKVAQFIFHFENKDVINVKNNVTASKVIKEKKNKLKTITEKTCGKCHVIKPVEAFNKSLHDRTGYQSYCRECSNKIRREYKKRNNEKKQKATFVESPDHTILFCNWLESLQKDVFDVSEFMTEHPDISADDLQKIISDQISKNRILQLSDSKFKICTGGK